MLISAKFENIYSFNEETRILFTASKSDQLPLQVSRAEKRDDISVLRMGLIYGANASGKSNIIKCLAIIREFALNGWSNRKYNYFKMTDEPQERSSIELEFKADGQFFAYGIAFSKGGLLEEWLYKTGSRTDAMIFERKRNGDSWENTIAPQFMKGEDGQFLKFLIDGTPTKGTFLSEYIKRNGKGIDAIKSARKWFENLTIIFPDTHRTDFPFRVVNDAQFKTVMRELLSYFGTGISDLRRVESKPEELGIPDEIRQKIEESLEGKDKKTGVVIHNESRFIFAEKDESMNLKWYELKTIHRKDDSESDYIFEMFEESDGTSRLFDFIPMLIDMRANDAVYIIDEVDRSLHPMLTLKLLEMYNSLLRTDSNMQLVCTTHESNLLSTAPIRQDEVWFVEKDKKGESHLSSLCEYKPRENVQKGYLNGRYGAIPFFGELNECISIMETEQLELFPNYGIKDDERLYVIGNGFDVHHCIESKYSDFKNWIRKNKDSNLVNLMDTFFSNARDFWSDIEKAFGEYEESSITAFCEPDNPEDFKYDHPGQWQAGIEDSISYIFGEVMNTFRDAFCEWVKSIDITSAKADLQLSPKSKYLSFNYTETLERCYHIPEKNVLHIHGSRMVVGDEFVLGHNSSREENEPYGNDDVLLPYQNAYSEVIKIMNRWRKATESIINRHIQFFLSLHNCKAVSVMGMSYNDIDLPYLRKISTSVAPNCKWILYYYSKSDYVNAEKVANELGLKDYCMKEFE